MPVQNRAPTVREPGVTSKFQTSMPSRSQRVADPRQGRRVHLHAGVEEQHVRRAHLREPGRPRREAPGIGLTEDEHVRGGPHLGEHPETLRIQAAVVDDHDLDVPLGRPGGPADGRHRAIDPGPLVVGWHHHGQAVSGVTLARVGAGCRGLVSCHLSLARWSVGMPTDSTGSAPPRPSGVCVGRDHRRGDDRRGHQARPADAGAASTRATATRSGTPPSTSTACAPP